MEIKRNKINNFKTKKRLSYGVYGGMILLAVTTIVLLVVFFAMATPAESSIYLGDNISDDSGWTYEILQNGDVHPADPVIIENNYDKVFEDENITAVKATRIMSETISAPDLVFNHYGIGIEVYFNDELLYSDFGRAGQSDNGFLTLNTQQRESISDINGSISVSLPEDYTDGTLTVVNYFAEDYVPAQTNLSYPILQNYVTEITPAVVQMVFPIVTTTISAILTLLLLMIFAVSIRDQKPEYSILILATYSLLFFFQTATQTAAGAYSSLPKLTFFDIVGSVYIDLLLVFLALKMTGKQRIFFLIGTALHFITASSRIIINTINNDLVDTNNNGIILFILLIALCVISIIEYRKKNEFFVCFTKGLIPMGIVMIFAVGCTFLYSGVQDPFLYFKNSIASAYNLNFRPINELVYNYIPVLSAITLIYLAIHTYMKRERILQGKAMRTEMAEQSYQNMKEAIRQTGAARHEMKHQAEVITVMLKKREIEKAEEYLMHISNSNEALPTVQYSNNLLVNMIVSPRLEKAKQNNIEVECSLQIPETIGIDETDFCILLTNLLDNAVEAAILSTHAKKHIRFQIWKDENTLLISCENSYCGELVKDKNGHYLTTKQDPLGHGYGIYTMNEICEKYGSILKIDANSETFSVKTALDIKNN